MFEEHRWIHFDVQEFVPLETGEINRKEALYMGPEWQPAINEYWRRCEVMWDWNQRMVRMKEGDRVRNMGVKMENLRVFG